MMKLNRQVELHYGMLLIVLINAGESLWHKVVHACFLSNFKLYKKLQTDQNSTENCTSNGKKRSSEVQGMSDYKIHNTVSTHQTSVHERDNTINKLKFQWKHVTNSIQ